jgi:peroxiredoxin
MPEVRSTFQLESGDQMPVFELPDAHGEVHSSDKCLGEKGVLVVFACNHCPFVVHLAKELGEKAREWSERGVATVAITSNDLENYPQDGPEPMKEFAREYQWDFPYLIDETQEVALSYGAACTPDFFLFDGEGKLFYAGQFDETRPNSGKTPSGKDLEAAVSALVAGEEPPNGIPASGCSIKWKAANQPQWWNAG